MKRLSVFLYSQILGKKIYDEFNDVLGELKDIYVSTDEGYPRAIGYNVKKDGSTFHYEFRSIGVYDDNGKIVIKTVGSREILPRTYTYLLSEHLLDKKIVDINGKKVVRVNDLSIAEIVGDSYGTGIDQEELTNRVSQIYQKNDIVEKCRRQRWYVRDEDIVQNEEGEYVIQAYRYA